MQKIEGKTIQSFEEYRELILDKTKEEIYYLLYNSSNFKKANKNTMLTREIYNSVNKIVNSSNIIKYISFKMKENYSTGEMQDFISILKQYNKILLTIYNPQKRDCFLLFTSSKKDLIMETKIKDFLEIGG